jgi:hypothetical protein
MYFHVPSTVKLGFQDCHRVLLFISAFDTCPTVMLLASRLAIPLGSFFARNVR